MKGAILLVALGAATLVLPPTASLAGGTSGADAANDVIDVAQHPLNSGRQPGGYTAALPSLDILNWSVNFGDVLPSGAPAGSKWITTKIRLKSKAPAPGVSATDVLAPGQTDASYSVEFLTNTQDTLILAGYECLPARSNDAGTPEDRVSLFRYQRTYAAGAGVCNGASTPANELEWISDGTKPAQDYAPRYHFPWYASDGNWMTLSADAAVSTDATDCAAGELPPCINVVWSFGWHEEFSQITWSFDGTDHDAIVDTRLEQPGLKARIFRETWAGSTNSNDTLVLQVPYVVNQTVSGVDDDLLVDEQRTYTYAKPGGQGVGSLVKAVLVQTGGTFWVQTPFRVCQFGPSLTPDGPLPSGIGYPQTIPGLGGPMPGADGGTSCLRNIIGLGTIFDWAPQNAMVLRQFPRAVSWAPNPSNANATRCKFPVGNRGNVGDVPEQIGVWDGGGEDSTYKVGFESNDSFGPNTFWVGVPAKNWWVEPATATNNGNYTNVGPSVPVPGVDGPDVLAPAIVGQTQPCNYMYREEGLHQFDQTPDFYAS